ncbi:MAG: peptidoglycan editing factor PgeF [Bacterioplanes sp.]|nr:peptidoglycan editing factor PgeF [Bacterioplanes sp.]
MAVIYPAWPMPAGIAIALTCSDEAIGVDNPYGTHNLALHVDDDAKRVLCQRQQLWRDLVGVRHIQWLQQVHGTEVVRACSNRVTLEADGCYTNEMGMACAVLTADCLPILFASADGRQVAAVHAGWRGLAAGIVIQALARFDRQVPIWAYLGVAIGPNAFEVGPEVKAAFAQAPSACFRKGQGDRYFADLYALARWQLHRCGVTHVYGGDQCSVSDDRYYSYRRLSVTGRMASLIWRY